MRSNGAERVDANNRQERRNGAWAWCVQAGQPFSSSEPVGMLESIGLDYLITEGWPQGGVRWKRAGTMKRASTPYMMVRQVLYTTVHLPSAAEAKGTN